METRDTITTLSTANYDSIPNIILAVKNVKANPACQIPLADGEKYAEMIKNSADIAYIFHILYRILYIENKYPNIAVFLQIVKKCIKLNYIHYAIDIYTIAKRSKVINIGMHINIMIAATMIRDFNILQIAYQDALKLKQGLKIEMHSLYHTMLNCLMQFKELYQCSNDPDQRAKVKDIIDEACLIYKESGITPEIIMHKDGRINKIDLHIFNRGSAYFALYFFLIQEQKRINSSKDRDKKLAIVELTIDHGMGFGSKEEDHKGRHPVKSGVYAFLKDKELSKIYDISRYPNVDNPGHVLCTIKEKVITLQKKNNPAHATRPTFVNFYSEKSYSPGFYYPQPIYNPPLNPYQTLTLAENNQNTYYLDPETSDCMPTPW